MEQLKLQLLNAWFSRFEGKQFLVRHFNIDVPTTMDFSVMYGEIQRVIDDFSTDRGYTTTLTAADVETYIDLAYQALTASFALQRTQNLLNIKDNRNRLVGEAFYRVADSTNLMSAEQLFTQRFQTSVPRYNTSIPNNTWNDNYASPFANMLVTPHMVKFAASIFSPAHSTPYENDEVIFDVFWPSSLAAASDVSTQINATLTALNAHPDLGSILKLLGFVTTNSLNIELTRDRLKQTLPVDSSGLALSIIQNSGVILRWRRANAIIAEFDTMAIGTDANLLIYGGGEVTPFTVNGVESISVPIEEILIKKSFLGNLIFTGSTLAYSHANGNISFLNYSGIFQTTLRDLIPVWNVAVGAIGVNTGYINNDWVLNYTANLDFSYTYTKDLCPFRRYRLSTLRTDIGGGLMRVDFEGISAAAVEPITLDGNSFLVPNQEYHLRYVGPYLVFGMTSKISIPQNVTLAKPTT